MTTEIRVATLPGQAHVAVVRDGRLIDYALWRPGTPDRVGDIVTGRISAVMPALAGSFVALADQQEGFLPDSEGAKGLTEGTVLPMRITRAAQANKGLRLSARLPECAQTGPGPDPVARMQARYPSAPVLVDDPAWLPGRARVEREVLDDSVAEAIDSLALPVVDLPNGARLSIWPTPALVAIDVDSGSARIRHEALNRAVVPGLAEQIRLRNLSGAIVVDLAGMSVRKRGSLSGDFAAALAADPLRPKLLGFTALGLAEIVRTRIHPPLHELLCGPLHAGLAALQGLLAATGPDPRSQPAVRANPEVVRALHTDQFALADLARRTGRAATLRPDSALPKEVWMLERDDG